MLSLSSASRFASKCRQLPRVPARSLQQSTQKRASETRAWLLGGTIALAGGFYVTHLESVPQTGRVRFRLVTPEAEQAVAARDAATIATEFRGHFLTGSDDRVVQVVRVGRRVAQATEAFFPPPRLRKLNWKFNVIDGPEKQAVVLPGGQIFVFTGLLDELKTDHALAAVLSHQAAHMMLGHEAENWSHKLTHSLPHWALWFLGYYPFAIDRLARPAEEVIAGLPNSSRLEAEANRMGVDIMAKASYEPKAYIRTFIELENKARKAPNAIELLASHHVGKEGMHELLHHLEEHYDLAKEDQQQFLLDFSLTAP